MDSETKRKLELIKNIDELRYYIVDIEAIKFTTNSYYFDVSKYFDTSNKIKAKDNLSCETAEQILLTHYLLYVCDRQMDYRRIFRIGGFVMSKLVKTFLSEEMTEEVYDSHIDKNDVRFKAEIENTDENENILKYIEKGKNNVDFSSRYCPNDIVSIFTTLDTLQKKYKKSFGNFLSESKDDVSNLAEEMYKLTYAIRQVKKADIKGEKWEKISDKFNTKGQFDKYSAKRIWCVLRDFLCHPYFSECYRKILGKNEQEFEGYKREQILKLELPGDVWNNNKKFAECFFGENYENNIPSKTKKYNSSKFLREFFNKEGINAKLSPIIFDTTFLFVPRMCNEDKCSICPFKTENNKKFLQEICHEAEGKYCTFLLYSTGIKYKCLGDSKNCKLNII